MHQPIPDGEMVERVMKVAAVMRTLLVGQGGKVARRYPTMEFYVFNSGAVAEQIRTASRIKLKEIADEQRQPRSGEVAEAVAGWAPVYAGASVVCLN
jgi:hypothetical protein